MAELFINHYTFPSSRARPTPEVISAALSRAFGQTLQFTFHPQGEHGAPRDWAEFTGDNLSIWAYWDPQRPMMELQVVEPMSRMLLMNPVLIKLGGTPLEPDIVWQRRIAYRKQARVKRVLWLLLVVAIIVAIIRQWGWWGAGFVVLTIAALVGGLAIAYARGMCPSNQAHLGTVDPIRHHAALWRFGMGRRMDSTTAGAWRERIGRQNDSPLSIRAWCRANGVHEHAFYWWRKRLGLMGDGGRDLRVPATRASTSMGFAEVMVTPSAVPSSGEPIRLRLAGDRELILPASMPMEAMARLIRAIEGACTEPGRGAA